MPCKPHLAGAIGIHLGDAALAEMGDGAEPQPPGLLDRRLRRRPGRVVEQLDPVIALAGRPAHPGPRLLRRGDVAEIPAVAQRHEGEQPRRDDCIFAAALAIAQRHVAGTGIERQAAHGRDAVGEPQPIAIGRVGRLLGIAIMAVDVDEAGQDVHSGRIELAVGAARRAIRRQRQARRARAVDALDAVAGNDDVDRPARRRAAAVDQRDSADDQPAEGPLALARLPVGNPFHRRQALRVERRRGGDDRGQESGGRAEPDKSH